MTLGEKLQEYNLHNIFLKDPDITRPTQFCFHQPEIKAPKDQFAYGILSPLELI